MPTPSIVQGSNRSNLGQSTCLRQYMIAIISASASMGSKNPVESRAGIIPANSGITNMAAPGMPVLEKPIITAQKETTNQLKVLKSNIKSHLYFEYFSVLTVVFIVNN